MKWVLQASARIRRSQVGLLRAGRGIRAGRVIGAGDRGGVSAVIQGAVRPLVSANRQKVQADFAGEAGAGECAAGFRLRIRTSAAELKNLKAARSIGPAGNA